LQIDYHEKQLHISPHQVFVQVSTRYWC